MNPDKKKVGCMVPFCAGDWCNRKRKKTCALRKEFLIYQKALRQELAEFPALWHYIYYWRTDEQKKRA